MPDVFDFTSYYPISKLKKKKHFLEYSPDSIDICIYQIIIYNNNPFLVFNLYKKNKILNWPLIQDFSSFKIISKISSLKEIINIINPTFNKSQLEYNGFINHANRAMLWFKYNNSNTIELSNNKKFYWISISEIINYKSFMNIYNIKPSLTDFFLHYPEFICLKKQNNLSYETPIIAYYGCDHYTLKYILKYGIFKQNTSCSFGAYYYFANLELAKKYSLLKKSNYSGIIRFVLFLKENNTNITNQFINKFHWVNNHNSLSIHKFDNKKNNKYIKYVIKDYKNIVPLSYCFINNK